MKELNALATILFLLIAIPVLLIAPLFNDAYNNHNSLEKLDAISKEFYKARTMESDRSKAIKQLVDFHASEEKEMNTKNHKPKKTPIKQIEAIDIPVVTVKDSQDIRLEIHHPKKEREEKQSFFQRLFSSSEYETDLSINLAPTNNT